MVDDDGAFRINVRDGVGSYLFATQGEELLALAPLSDARASSSVVVDETSSAIAVVLLHPLLASANPNDMARYSEVVKGTRSFADLEAILRSRMDSGRPLVDLRDVELVDAYGMVVGEVLESLVGRGALTVGGVFPTRSGSGLRISRGNAASLEVENRYARRADLYWSLWHQPDRAPELFARVPSAVYFPEITFSTILDFIQGELGRQTLFTEEPVRDIRGYVVTAYGPGLRDFPESFEGFTPMDWKAFLAPTIETIFVQGILRVSFALLSIDNVPAGVDKVVAEEILKKWREDAVEEAIACATVEVVRGRTEDFNNCLVHAAFSLFQAEGAHILRVAVQAAGQPSRMGDLAADIVLRTFCVQCAVALSAINFGMAAANMGAVLYGMDRSWPKHSFFMVEGLLVESITHKSGALLPPSDLYFVEPFPEGRDFEWGRIEGPSGEGLLIVDVALMDTGEIFAISHRRLYRIEFQGSRLRASAVADLLTTEQNVAVSLESSGRGSLWLATALGDFVEIGTDGSQSKIGDFGSNWGASGDLALDPDGRLWATVYRRSSGVGDFLAQIDPASGRIVGTPQAIGYEYVYGLGFVRGQLYGVTTDFRRGNGAVIVIDRSTGRGSLVRRLSFSAGGAAGRLDPSR